MELNTFGKLAVLVCVFTVIGGCNATHTAINKRKMDVQTKMSATVFLDPIPANKKTIFLQIRNTSDKTELDLIAPITEALVEKGYSIVSVPEGAHYLLQVNILQVGRSDLRATNQALNRGFGAALRGATSGAAIGSLATKEKRGKSIAVGSVVGATVSTITDAMVQDVLYNVIADVQISEHIGNSIVIKEKTRSKLKQGTRGTLEVTSTQKIDWKRYQTRVVGTANKVNLTFTKAAPCLIQGLTRSITGVF